MARLPALAPFQIRSFRFQWPADLLTSWAFEMETLILGWYVLVETGSVLFLTVFGAVQYGGTLIAPMLGVASDRIGHRSLLSGMRAVYAVVAASLLILALAGLLTPAVVAAVGVRGALVATGLLLPLLVLAAAARLRALDRATRQPTAELALLRGLPLLAPLPPLVLERLARRAVPVHAAAGETVVVQGEPGDRFFAIAGGELEVTVDGRFVRRIGAGDSFGEIALLHQVPRTATVRVIADADLLALDSDDFIPAMTQIAGSAAAAADGVVGGSLVLEMPKGLRLLPSVDQA